MIRSRLEQGQTRRIAAALAALAVACLAGLLFFFNPEYPRLYPPCVFHHLTGWHCPGCGTARGLHALIHGRLVQALAFNPFMVAVLPFLAVAGARGLRDALAGGPPKTRRLTPAWAIWLLAGLVGAFWVLRNIPWAPFTLLAPHRL